MCLRNITSSCDLLAGHNFVLLAIRVGVITLSNMEQFPGNIWFLQDNLYAPAAKLISDHNPTLIDSIFQHAEAVGILSSGYAFNMIRETRRDMSDCTSTIRNDIRIMADRMCCSEQTTQQ